jgi:beta-lactamase regulating signal transducer with metallopeptidase domain
MSLWLKSLEFAADSGAFLLHTALKATLVTITIVALLLLMRRASAAVRHTLWLAGCWALLLLPLLTVRLPAWQPALIKPVLAPAVPLAQGTEGAKSEVGFKSKLEDQTASSNFLLTLAIGSSPVEDNTPLLSTTQYALASCFTVWLLGAALVSVRFVGGVVTAQRLQKLSEPVTGSDLKREFEVAAHSLGFKKLPQLLVTSEEHLPVPLTWGVFRPVVLMPRSAFSWSASCRSAALLHELAHIRRSDWLAQSLASLTCAVYWFHPLAWFVACQLRLESERATDDRVLSTGIAAPEYGSSLVEIVRVIGTTRRNTLLKFAVPVAGTSPLETRLRSILDPLQNRGSVTRRLVACIVLVGCAALVPLAAAKSKGLSKPEAPTLDQPVANLSTPEATVRSFVAAINARDFTTAVSCVYGGIVPDPFLLERAKESNVWHRDEFILGPLRTIIHGNRAQITSWSGLMTAKQYQGDDELSSGRVSFGQVLLRRDNQGWKISPARLDSESLQGYSDPASILGSTASFLIRGRHTPDFQATAHTDSTFAACVVNLEKLAEALPHQPFLGRENNLGKWQQYTLRRLRRGFRPSTDLDHFFHCPAHQKGQSSYSINQNLSGVYQEATSQYEKEIVLLYEGTESKLDFRHNGKALVVLFDRKLKLVSREDAKRLVWKPGLQ